MKLEEFLTETRSEPVLFHFMDTSKALEVLERGAFQLGIAGEADTKDIQKDQPYYLSCARSANGRYAHGHVVGTQFELNRDWLKARYKVFPINYWANFPMKDSEQEDRLISDKPTIVLPQPPTALIRAVHVLIPTEDRAQDWGTQREKNLILACKRMGIPVYVYDREAAFYTGNPAASVSLGKVMGRFQIKKRPHPYWFREPRKGLARYRELIFKKDRAELSPDALKLVGRIEYPYYHAELLRGLSADLHNHRSSDRPEAHKTVIAIRQTGARTLAEFIQLMYEKWAKPARSANE